MTRHRGGVDRGLQIGRRNRHTEIHARAAFDGAVHRGKIRQVALHDLGAKPTQGAGALVLPPDQGAYLVAFGEQHCGEVATDGADGAGGSGNEDRAVARGFHYHAHHHVADLTLRSEFRRGDHRASTVRGSVTIVLLFWRHVKLRQQICREVQVNLTYRLFCGLGLEDSSRITRRSPEPATSGHSAAFGRVKTAASVVGFWRFASVPEPARNARFGSSPTV